jgi:N-acetylglucosaminyl-diphospho-decaprenol L-rhamnosyltransferase
MSKTSADEQGAAHAPHTVLLPLTVVVLTKNEERDLPACLASIAALAEQVIVLDSGSTDHTVTIAQAHGALVRTRPFDGYASQRNAALNLLADPVLDSGPWVLFLDADEQLTPAGRAEIRAALTAPIADDTPAGYWFPRHNEFFGQRLKGGGWWPDEQLRLLRRDRARYDTSREVHEVVILDGPAARLREPLIHHNYDTWAEFHARQRAYAVHHARDLARRGVHPRPWTYVNQPLRAFRRRYLTLGGWRDGRLGIQLALAMAYYEWHTYWRMRSAECRVRNGGLSRRGGSVPAGDSTNAIPRSAFRVPRSLALSVILVSRNTRALTLRCLASVEASLAGVGISWEAIVVDNASADGTVAAVQQAFPDARVIESGGNRGFAAGNNLGLSEARGEALLLLNPDTEVVGDAIPRLLAELDADPALGIIGPALRYPDGTAQESRRRFPTRLTPFLESTLVQHYWGRNRVLDHYYMADQPNDIRQDVDWLSGACLLARRAAVEQAGGFDEGFFMYSEELEWCARLRAHGWRVAYEPAALVVHHEGASSAQAVSARHINFNTSKLRFYRRRYGWLYAAILRRFLLLTYVIQLAQEGAKWLLGHKRPLRRQRIGAYFAVLRSGLRPARQATATGGPLP